MTYIKRIFILILTMAVMVLPFFTLPEVHAADDIPSNLKPTFDYDYVRSQGWNTLSNGLFEYIMPISNASNGTITLNIPTDLSQFGGYILQVVNYSGSEGSRQTRLTHRKSIQVNVTSDRVAGYPRVSNGQSIQDIFYQIYVPEIALGTSYFDIGLEASFWTLDTDGYSYFKGDDYSEKRGLIKPYLDEGYSDFFTVIQGPYYDIKLPDGYVLEYSYKNSSMADYSLFQSAPVTSLNHVIYTAGRGLFDNQGNPLAFDPIYENSWDNAELLVCLRMKKVSSDVDPTNPDIDWSEVADLPKTAAGRLGTIKYAVSNYDVVIEISYDSKTYYMKYRFASDTDMTMFKTNESYYMNVSGDNPQIFINKSDKMYLRDILESPEDEKPAFVPHVIWTLKTNELTNVDKYDAYVYVKQGTSGQIVAYFYTDEFIIDKMLSASLTYTSRIKKTSVFGLKTEYGPWLPVSWSYTNEETLKYRKNTTEWYDHIPGWNLISLAIRTNTWYEMPRIESVDLNNPKAYHNITKSEIETQFRSMSKNFTALKTNPRYKIWAMALEEGVDESHFGVGANTEIYKTDNPKDTLNFNIIEIVYETNGKVYTTLGSDMDLFVAIEKKLDGIGNEPKKLNWPVIVALAVFVISIVATAFNGYIFKKNNWFKVLLIAAVLAVMAYLLILFWPEISSMVVLRL